MTHVALIRLSWPQRELFQNDRSHHFAKAKAVRAYKAQAWKLALEQNVKRLNTKTPTLIFSFHPRTGPGRKPDLHNMPATMKAAIDGIADAMGCDDAGFRCIWPETWGEPTKGGCVLIEIMPPVVPVEVRGTIS